MAFKRLKYPSMILDPEIETMPRPQLRRLQNERLRRMLRYLRERSAFYRERLQRSAPGPDSIRSVEDLHRLPFTLKDDLRRNYPFGILAVDISKVARIHASTGTSGKPTVAAYTRGDLDIFAHLNARSLAAAGAEPGMKLHNAFGYGLFTGGMGLHAGGERLGMTVVPVSGGMTERQVLLIQDFKPEVLCCTPSYAQTLALRFRQEGIDPEEISLRYAVMGAEPWTETIREEVDAGLGVRSTNLYGLSEIIGPGVSQESVEVRQGSHVWEDHFFAEIVDPESGEPLDEGEEGVLVLTTLTKEAMPLLRYWTGDICSLNSQESPCRRTHVRMSRIKGRSDDMLIVRGVNLYPSQVEEALQGIEGIEPLYELVLRRSGTLDELETRVELDPELYREADRPQLQSTTVDSQPKLAEVRDRIAARIREKIGLGVRVTLLEPGAAPRSQGGKLKRVRDERKLG